MSTKPLDRLNKQPKVETETVGSEIVNTKILTIVFARKYFKTKIYFQ